MRDLIIVIALAAFASTMAVAQTANFEARIPIEVASN